MRRTIGSRSRRLMLLIGVLVSLLASSLGGIPLPATNDLSITREGLIYYQFTATNGDSMSRLARTALLCFTLEYSGESYSNEQLTYSETSLVDMLGRRPLLIGERIIITSQQISDALLASRQLSPQTLQAWQTYSRQIDYQSARLSAQDQIGMSQEPTTDPYVYPALSLPSVVATDQGASDIWWYVATFECLLIVWILFRH